MGKASRTAGWRRRDLLGAAGLAGTALLPTRAGAVPSTEGAKDGAPSTATYHFRVGRTELNPDGRQPVRAVTVNGTMPGQEIRVREGELLRVQLENRLDDQPTSIHWHGLLLPAAMDGVPDLSMAPLPPQRVFVYEYPLKQSGTYWYHSHVGTQEQSGLFGPLVIEPREEPLHYDRDYVVMLSDWLHRDPDAVLAGLRKAPRTGTGMAGMKMGDSKMAGMGMAGGAMPGMKEPDQGMPKAGMAGQGGSMDMTAGADLADVAYDAFLLNGRGNQDPWTCVAKAGERVRLRLINAGSSTFFRVMVDGHPMTVVHADGSAVRPVEVDNLLLGMGETYDVLVTLAGSGSFTIRAEAQDGSGQAIGVLHTTDAEPRADLSKPKWGARQLAYRDLAAVRPTTLPDGPVRSYELALTGDMARYVWSIDGQVYPDAEPLTVRPGERVRVALTNRTGMWHPMHLHGHFFRLLDTGVEPSLCPLKHTVSLAPKGTARFEFLADNPGRWFFHCHNLYHLEAGMAREWIYTT